MANDELGRIGCECGAVASVFQAKRKGAHLYTRCPSCGLDQKTGARPQARLWFLTDWNDGRKPARPENVPEDRPAWLDDPGAVVPKGEPKQEPKQEPKTADFDPGESVAGDDQESEFLTEKQPKTGLKPVIGLLLIVAAAGGVLWKM